ncbi:MAG TPA: isoleucine--tRNA ligase, partial [Syntrophorhabdales bacterium]|nr:isoleucine--tRNA ligase [Syntrophorhabdales bacterium]
MDYKETLNLPRTPFPMKGNLPVKEKQILEFWNEIGLYGKLLAARAGAPAFILHDGPPYANGHIHLGTALNKILKDIIVKSKFMAGLRADYVPGWDCHGLPIETQVEKEIQGKQQSMPKAEFRRYCRKYAERFIDIQRAEFKRLGGIGDWEHPYITMDYAYQATIINELAQFFDRGEVYRKKRPVHWCISCRTALAEAEIEYEMEASPSIYVKFALRTTHEVFKDYPKKPIFMLIWTTTPWTLPANLAIAIHPDFKYVAVETKEQIYIMVEELVKDTMAKAGIPDYRVIGEVPVQILRELTFQHPFIDRPSVVVFAEYVTKDVGTGAVHTAPGHGEEDYETGLEYGLDVYSPVNENGEFTGEVEAFKGMNVFESNAHIIQKLKALGALLYTEQIEHSYPHCWRCKKPVIFRATEQWFISMDAQGLRKRSLEALDHQVTWIPAWGRDRIYNMLSQRPDWCISRQRSWGVPITIFYCEQCRKPYWSRESFQIVTEAVRKDGADVWFEKEASAFLPEGVTCTCGNTTFVKEEDILDVWFDSGSSFAAVLKVRPGLTFPCDMYLEGSDQHRGWFHSSLLVSIGNNGVAPYKSVLTHGFVVDGKGRKMSKSLGNIIAPEEIIEKYGAEILRLWVTYEDYRDDIKISKEMIDRIVETYRRIRNTFRFLHANLHGDFDPTQHKLSYEQLSYLDRWILSRLQNLIEKVREAYETYAFHAIFHAIHNFCAIELSALYLDIVKDRMYVEKKDAIKRRASQSVVFETLTTLLRLAAPILSFTTEEMWSYLKPFVREESVLLGALPEVNRAYVDGNLEREWDRIWEIREAVNKKIEEKRIEKTIGHPLDAKVRLEVPAGDYELLSKLGDELKDLLIVSQVELASGDGVGIIVSGADGEKCQRCWQYSTDIQTVGEFPNLCKRCRDTVIS